jgi:hypothetical protein
MTMWRSRYSSASSFELSSSFPSVRSSSLDINRTDNNTTNRNILKLSLQLFQHQLTAPTTISTTEIKNCFCSNIFFIEILLAWTTIPTAATTVSQATVFNYYLNFNQNIF